MADKMIGNDSRAIPAIEGGPMAVTEPYGSGNRFGTEELRELEEALSQGGLFYSTGMKTRQFCEEGSRFFGRKHCVPVSSGTAAVHTSLAALGIGPGDEVVTSPITDMGSIIGILWQQAYPVFADIDLNSGNNTAESIEKVITEKTKAILLVHLMGIPCEMDSIIELSGRRRIPIVEDCAQSYMAEWGGRQVGTFTEMSAFSMNDFKHISAGEAGFVLSDNDDLAREAGRFADKYYERNPDCRMPKKLGMNYRISELQSAVALAQLRKLPDIIRRKRELGDAFVDGIKSLPGLHPLVPPKGGRSSYHGVLVRMDEPVYRISAEKFTEALQAEGVRCGFGHTGAAVYEYPVMREQAFFPGCKGMPYEKEITNRYCKGLCPKAEQLVKTVIGFEISGFYSMRNVEQVIEAIWKLSKYYCIEI